MSQAPVLADLLRAAQLDQARALLVARVKAAPNDARARLDLADLLLLFGEWDKADGHADLANTFDPSLGVPVALLRQLLRAAAWRDETFRDRRPPDLVTEPDAAVKTALAMLADAPAPDEKPADPSGTRDGQAFVGLRDLDDRTAGVLEVLTGNGRYMWVPWAHIAALRPAAPEKLRDLVWRPAEIEVRGGPSGTVYVPVLYPMTAGEGDARHRLGQETDWIEAPDGSARGIGQRCLLIGDDVLTLGDFAELVVAA